jgi:1-acyl-sn-glycerol-3-phosphate acyltransferase
MDSRFSRPAVALFELFFRPWMKWRVRAVLVSWAAAPPVDRPLLLAANHVSWWDAFVLREVQRALRPGAPMYVVMSSDGLARYPYFRRMGVIGVDSSAGSVARALRYLRDRLRERPDSTVVFFPQGRIWPSHRRPLGFRRGIEVFGRRLSACVLPVGIHAEPLSTVSPTYFVSIGEAMDGRASVEDVERRVQAELDAVLGFVAEHGEDAASAWAHAAR